MSIIPPAPGEPRRPDGPRDPGDAWVVADDGRRFWGRFGAAGLLAVDRDRGVLLQHRVEWSHFGGTWGLPGGARHEHESAIDAALREAAEEAGVPEGGVVPRFSSVLDEQIWTYATVVADVTTPFEPVISDPESLELSWVPVDAVETYPLHPGFAASWPVLRQLIDVRPVIVVDAANVVGSVPDGWWNDRAGAAERLAERIERLADEGVEASALELAGTQWYPEWVVVVEGQARGAARDETGAGRVRVVAAAGAGDDEIVAQATSLAASGRRVTVITSDRGLAERSWQAAAPDAVRGGAGSVEVRGARWLTERAGR